MTAQPFPLPVPSHIGWQWFKHPALFERLQVLGEDQEGVVERPRPEPGRELQCSCPVLTGHQLLNGTGQTLV